MPDTCRNVPYNIIHSNMHSWIAVTLIITQMIVYITPRWFFRRWPNHHNERLWAIIGYWVLLH